MRKCIIACSSILALTQTAMASDGRLPPLALTECERGLPPLSLGILEATANNAAAEARTIYVNNTIGNDGDGSAESPFRNMDAAIEYINNLSGNITPVVINVIATNVAYNINLEASRGFRIFGMPNPTITPLRAPTFDKIGRNIPRENVIVKGIANS